MRSAAIASAAIAVGLTSAKADTIYLLDTLNISGYTGPFGQVDVSLTD
jgi:hypothetical protein